MKSFKKLALSAAFVASLAVPAIAPLSANAQVAIDLPSDNIPSINCTYIGQSELPRGGCDLSVKKYVSVNGSAFVDADTSADASSASLGDTVTWKIVLANVNPEFQPTGSVYINDILPSGVTYVSHLASVGDYQLSGFFANDWYVPLLQSNGDGFDSTLPATLTITTTASSTGLSKNTAALVKFDNGHCDGGCAYSDNDSFNNSDDAWISVSGKPVVLGESTSATLSNTGSGTTESLVAGSLILATLGVAFSGRFVRKNS